MSAVQRIKQLRVELSKQTRLGFSWPDAYMGTLKKLKSGIWPWENGCRSRLPEHYKQKYLENYMIKPRPVHYKPQNKKYTINEHGEKIRYVDAPIPLVFPPEADKGLWGGEGIIEGIKQKDNLIHKEWNARIWKPLIVKRVYYSEILDLWMALKVTITTMDQIDECFGFDYYILKTHPVDLNSKLAMKLRRQMLYALHDKSFHRDNLEKQEHVYNKYKEYKIPYEEIEWLGLDINEAEKKQQMLEETVYWNSEPKKSALYDHLIDQLRSGAYDDDDNKEKSMLQKINPFKK